MCLCACLGLEADLVQLASLLEALHAVLHQEQADAMGCRLGLAVGHRHHHNHVTHPPVGDEHLHKSSLINDIQKTKVDLLTSTHTYLHAHTYARTHADEHYERMRKNV